ncbi:MAG: alpha/beta hydrolase [Dehalococcoidia bacterium]|nr:alpha/beta hydrolase [Dehalococcoidia bacterium]
MPEPRSPAAREPHLLLVHGFFSTRDCWEPLQRELGRGISTVAPNLLGYGESRCSGEYNLERVVEHLAPVVEREGFTHVLGHSMGGIIALALAGQLPGQFERIGVAGLPVYGSREEGLQHLYQRWRYRVFLRADGVMHVGCELLHRTSRAWAPFAPLVVSRRPRKVLVGAFDHCRASHAGGLDQIVFAGHTEELANRLDVPVAAIHGGKDGAAPPGPAEELAARHGWDFTLIPNHGHQAVIVQPRRVARWVREKVLETAPVAADEELAPATGP